MNVCIDDDVDRARDQMRHFIALYVGGMGSRKRNFYNALVQRYGFADAAREVQDLYLDGKKDEAAAAVPARLIDTITLAGPRDRVRERLAVYRDAGVGTLIVSPIAFERAASRRMVRELAEMLYEALSARGLRRPGSRVPGDRAGRRARPSRTRRHARDLDRGATTWSARACASARRPSTRSSRTASVRSSYTRRPSRPRPSRAS